MKVLVTGGAGFIGSHLCEKLVENNNEVHSLDDYSTGSKDNHIDGRVLLSVQQAIEDQFGIELH